MLKTTAVATEIVYGGKVVSVVDATAAAITFGMRLFGNVLANSLNIQSSDHID